LPRETASSWATAHVPVEMLKINLYTKFMENPRSCAANCA
jgi:hypothetical protein